MDGFYMDVESLTEFVGQLGELADEGASISQTLSAVTADTGRADSDAMGRLGPADTADLVGDLCTEIDDDRVRVMACIADSAQTDAESAVSIWESWSR